MNETTTVGTIAGVDTVVAVLGGFIGGLPDIHAEEQDVIASDDLVAGQLVVSATQTGDLLGIPASGRAVRWDAVDIYGVTDDGKDQRAVGLRGHGCHRQPARRVHAPKGGLKR
jgi:predicted ester cyclase